MVNIYGHRYPEVVNQSIDELHVWCHRIYRQLTKDQQDKTRMLFIKLNQRLKRIQDVGLKYITLDRSVPSLSGGEAQRLKLATQFGTGLSNILYIMDEPSKGLHLRDYLFLMDTIVDLKKHGDYIVELGPSGGDQGGHIIKAGYQKK